MLRFGLLCGARVPGPPAASAARIAGAGTVGGVRVLYLTLRDGNRAGTNLNPGCAYTQLALVLLPFFSL